MKREWKADDSIADRQHQGRVGNEQAHNLVLGREEGGTD